jgi:hypothetical protein
MRKFSVDHSWLAAIDMLDWPIAAGSPRSSPKICYPTVSVVISSGYVIYVGLNWPGISTAVTTYSRRG